MITTTLIDRQNVLARQDEIWQASEHYHQTKKANEPQSSLRTKLSSLFSGRIFKKQTAVTA